MSILSLMHTKSSFIFVSKFNIFWISFLVITMTSRTEESGMKSSKKIYHLNHKQNTCTFYLESLIEQLKSLSNTTWFYNKASPFGNSDFCKRETPPEYKNDLSFFVWLRGCYERDKCMLVS